VKPENVYLTKEGRPILIDFGAARQAVGERSQSLSVVMTPGYAPYEQYRRDGDQGPHTDVYGAGATLYRMVTGKKPPPATDRIVDDTLEPPHRVNPEVPEGLSRVIFKAVKTGNKERTSNAETLKVELQEGPQVETAPDSRAVEEAEEVGEATTGDSFSAREAEKESGVPASKAKPPTPSSTEEDDEHEDIKKIIVINSENIKSSLGNRYIKNGRQKGCTMVLTEKKLYVKGRKYVPGEDHPSPPSSLEVESRSGIEEINIKSLRKISLNKKTIDTGDIKKVAKKFLIPIFASALLIFVSALWTLVSQSVVMSMAYYRISKKTFESVKISHNNKKIYVKQCNYDKRELQNFVNDIRSERKNTHL
jgi:hypothetical protein